MYTFTSHRHQLGDKKLSQQRAKLRFSETCLGPVVLLVSARLVPPLACPHLVCPGKFCPLSGTNSSAASSSGSPPPPSATSLEHPSHLRSPSLCCRHPGFIQVLHGAPECLHLQNQKLSPNPTGSPVEKVLYPSVPCQVRRPGPRRLGLLWSRISFDVVTMGTRGGCSPQFPHGSHFTPRAKSH